MGHAVTGLFSGGSKAPAQEVQEMQSGTQSEFQQSSCDVEGKAFIKCMEESGNDIGRCQYYMDMMKMCQERARFS